MMMLMTSMLGCAACSSDGASKEAADVSENDNVPTDFQIQYTTPVPSDFFQAATQQEPQASVNATGFQTRGASAGSQSNAINELLNGLGYK